MRLTQFSNFSIRILMYAALKPLTPTAVPEMASALGVSYDHLKKVAASLCQLGYLDTVRGRSGGFRLARSPESIVIGSVLRATEGMVNLVECFDLASNTCPLAPACRLRIALSRALDAFFVVLDQYALADLITVRDELRSLLRLTDGETATEPHAQTERSATRPTLRSRTPTLS